MIKILILTVYEQGHYTMHLYDIVFVWMGGCKSRFAWNHGKKSL